MQIDDFVFHRPKTLAEACGLARELGNGAWFLAGGTDVVVDLKRRLHSAEHLISLAGIAELKGVRERDGGVEIGALTKHAEVASSELVRSVFPALAEAAGQIGGRQVRSQATIGGNWCGGVPCADTPPVSIVGRAWAVVTDGTSEREIAAEDFIIEPRITSLKHGEILKSIRVPAPRPNSGSSFQRFTLRGGLALAVASAAAAIDLDGDTIESARIALGAVGPTPIIASTATKLLAGQKPSEALFEEAGRAAGQDAKPITDIRGSEQYRREIVEVLTKRALQESLQRAQANTKAGA